LLQRRVNELSVPLDEGVFASADGKVAYWLPDSLRDTATAEALEALANLDLTALADIAYSACSASSSATASRRFCQHLRQLADTGRRGVRCCSF
jgi:hypothetical protein